MRFPTARASHRPSPPLRRLKFRVIERRSLPLSAVLLFLSLSVSSVYAASSADANANRIVAVVNNEVITQAELNRALVPAYLQLQATLGPEELAEKMDGLRKEILEQIIDEKLLLQEANNPRPVEVGKGRVGTPPVITVSDAEVEEVLQETRSRFPNPEAFEEALSQQGLTLEDLKTRFREQAAMQKLVGREIRSRVSLSPAEITSYYESHRDEFVTRPAVQVATILIRPQNDADAPRAASQAQDLRRQLTQGADFYELAQKYSDGFNAKMGGRIGVIEKGKSLKEIDDALFKLKAGDISPVIKTPAGFQFFRVESVQPAKQSTLEEAKAEIKYRLLSQKSAQRYREWIAKLRSESYITIK